jgi:MoxR-like ATPase
MRATHLVGRERDLALLDGAVRAALSGSGRVVLVRGEPGIGKTSLARVACESAASLGLSTAWGRAWEQDGAPPF